MLLPSALRLRLTVVRVLLAAAPHHVEHECPRRGAEAYQRHLALELLGRADPSRSASGAAGRMSSPKGLRSSRGFLRFTRQRRFIRALPTSAASQHPGRGASAFSPHFSLARDVRLIHAAAHRLLVLRDVGDATGPRPGFTTIGVASNPVLKGYCLRPPLSFCHADKQLRLATDDLRERHAERSPGVRPRAARSPA